MTSEHERALWARVDAAFDARRAPSGDPELAADLTRAPEVQAAVARLEAALDVLTCSEPARAPRWAWRVPLALAASLAAVVVLARRPPAAPQAPAPSSRGASAIAAPRDGAVVYEARVVIERTPPPEPRGAVVVRPPTRVVAWTVGGAPYP
ncbi:MAG: hypothetical protein R3F49_13155 [Planctomycetota bacterium]